MSFHVLQFLPSFIPSIYQHLYLRFLSAVYQQETHLSLSTYYDFHHLSSHPFTNICICGFYLRYISGKPTYLFPYLTTPITFHSICLPTFASAGNPLVDQILPLQFEHLLPDVVLYPLPFIDSFQLPTFVCSDLIVILQSNGTDCCKYQE